MKKYSKRIAGVLCGCLMMTSMCACSPRLEHDAIDPSEGLDTPFAQNADNDPESTSEATEATEGVKLMEETLAQEETVSELSETLCEAQETSQETGDTVSRETEEGEEGTPRVTDCGFNEPYLAKEAIMNGVKAIVNRDWETLVKYSNIKDLYRIAENELPSDEELTEVLESSPYGEDWKPDEWHEEEDYASVLLKEYEDVLPEAMDAEDLKSVNEVVEWVCNTSQTTVRASQSGSTYETIGSDWMPTYTAGYKLDVSDGNGLVYFYALKCKDDDAWHYDLCFCAYRDSIKFIESIPSDAIITQ